MPVYSILNFTPFVLVPMFPPLTGGKALGKETEDKEAKYTPHSFSFCPLSPATSPSPQHGEEMIGDRGRKGRKGT